MRQAEWSWADVLTLSATKNLGFESGPIAGQKRKWSWSIKDLFGFRRKAARLDEPRLTSDIERRELPLPEVNPRYVPRSVYVPGAQKRTSKRDDAAMAKILDAWDKRQEAEKGVSRKRRATAEPDAEAAAKRQRQGSPAGFRMPKSRDAEEDARAREIRRLYGPSVSRRVLDETSGSVERDARMARDAMIEVRSQSVESNRSWSDATSDAMNKTSVKTSVKKPKKQVRWK